MAVDKLVDSTQLNSDLTSVANAIRQKGGTSAQLAFPSGFVSAIGDISGDGGGGGGEDTLTKKLINTLTSYENSDLTSIPQGGLNFMGSAFKSLSLPNVTSAGQDAFRSNYVTSFNLPKLQTAGQSLFYQSFSVEQIVLPAWVGMTANVQNLFAYCSVLLAVDLGPNQIGTLGNYTFYNSYLFSTLILRSSTQIGLSNINAFNGTLFASGGSGGTLYVPQAKISEYTQATNWSTILGYANNQILPIEGSIYETQYADGTPIT